MRAIEFLSNLETIGIKLSRDGENIKIVAQGDLPPAIVDKIRSRKSLLLKAIDKRNAPFKVGLRVQTPDGTGRVWEHYNNVNRIGVVLDGREWPRFYAMDVCHVF